MKTTDKSPTNALDRPQDYPRLLSEIKERIRCAQYQALKAVNKELIGLYWDIGRMIAERQEKSDGAGRSWKTCLRTCVRSFQESPVFPYKIYGICASFTWNTTAMKNSNHWLEKLLGPTIWSLWANARTLWSGSSICA